MSRAIGSSLYANLPGINQLPTARGVGNAVLEGMRVASDVVGVASDVVKSGVTMATRASLYTTTGLLALTGKGVCTVGDGLTAALDVASKGLDTLSEDAYINDYYLAGDALAAAGLVPTVASPALKFATGVVDTVTGHPFKAYNVASGNTPVEINADTRAAVNAAIENFRKDPAILKAHKDLVGDLLDVGTTARRNDGASFDADQDFAAALLSGAHVAIKDGGKRYESWKDNGDLGAHDRVSSHYSDGKSWMARLNGTGPDPLHTDDPQKGIDIPGLGHLLFGTRLANNANESEGRKETWFQFEGHGVSSRDVVAHTADFVIHKASGNAQVGPMGLVKMTEKDGSNLVIP